MFFDDGEIVEIFLKNVDVVMFEVKIIGWDSYVVY